PHLPEPAPRLEIGKVLHNLFDRGVDALEILLIEGTALEIALGELQTLEGHVIQIVRQRLLITGKLGPVSGFRSITREHSLEEALLRGKLRFVTEQHLEATQALDMA